MTTPDAVASILERLSAIPADADVSLVIRHAEREDIPAGTFGHDVNLTADGVAAAERLGAALPAERAVTAVSSPVPRCVQTADAILRGAGSPAAVATDRRLGDPGPFIVKTEVAGPLFLELPIPEIARRQLQDADPPPGMRPTAEGIEILLSGLEYRKRHLYDGVSSGNLVSEFPRCFWLQGKPFGSILLIRIGARHNGQR